MAWLRTKTLFNIARHLWSRTCLRLCKRRTLNCLSSINKLKALNLVSSAALCQQEARFMWRIKRNNKQKQFLWLKNWIEEIDEQLCCTNAGNIRKQTTCICQSCLCYHLLSFFLFLRPLRCIAYQAVCLKSIASFEKMTSNRKERQLYTIQEIAEISPGCSDDR